MITTQTHQPDKSFKSNATHVFQQIRENWNRFWFLSPGPAQMTLFRGAFGCVMFFTVFTRGFDLDFFFGPRGMVRPGVLSQMLDMGFRRSVFEFFPSMTAIWIGHIVLLVALACLIWGVFPRISALVALFLHLSFVHRNPAVAYGVDVFASYYLLYLCFADYRKGPRPGDAREIIGSMAYRLCQIQVCLAYGFSGLDKARGASWWQGEAIWMVLSNRQQSTVDLSWVGHFPVILAFATYLTIFWEIYFPILIWFKPVGRRIALTIGIFFHIGIALAMGLISFSSFMISTYSLFIDPELAEKITHCIKKYAVPRKVFGQISDQSGV